MPHAPASALLDAENDPRLGRTHAERVSALGRARKIAKLCRGAMYVACAWLAVWPEPYPLVFTVVAALPWLAFLLCRKYRGAFAIDNPGRGGLRGDLTLLLAVPTGVLALRAVIDSHLVIVGPLFLPALAIWIALVGCAHSLGPGWRGWRRLPLLVLMTFPYPPGAIAIADQVFDFEPPVSLLMPVTGKRAFSGRGRVLYLRVPPWGLRRRPNEIEVKPDLYSAVRVGDAVCLQVHPGALGIPWYEVQPGDRC